MIQVAVVVALIILWTLWLGGQAGATLRTTDPDLRRRRAQRLLMVVSLGVPLVVALLLVA